MKLLAPSTFHALDWAPYDIWMERRTPPPLSPSIVLLTRDDASEARFGAEAWDHALFARVLTALARAGATVIGLDVPMGGPSTPGRGGAAGDAMLTEATRATGRVVYPLVVRLAEEAKRPVSAQPHHSWPVMPRSILKRLPDAALTGGLRPVLAQQAAGIGHALIPPDKDGVVRRVPLYVRIDDRAVPAFGMALLAGFLKVAPEQIMVKGQTIYFHESRFPDNTMRRLAIPIDGEGRMLINYSGRENQPAFAAVTFLDVWRAIERGEPDKLEAWVAGKVVILLPRERSAALRPTPLEDEASDGFIQANVLNTLLTESWIQSAPPFAGMLSALVLAGLGAWFFLAFSGPLAVACVVVLTLTYIAIVVAALSAGSLMLPMWVPLFALGLASGGTTLGMHLTTSHRVRTLEAHMQSVQQELGAARDALVCRESVVEGLEEDLEVTRAAVARSAGKEQELVRSAEALRAQLGDAQGQEDSTRRRLLELERELAGLRAASDQAGELSDAELERLRRECEDMGIVSRDPTMLAVFRDVKKGARSPIPVLLLGEPGTGKELFARAVHRLSPRAERPFIPVNMAAISPELFESELFGHVKGSFTGALIDRKGYFEQAHLGTIFLDEIGDLRLEHQGKLLRVLQNKTFHRVGDTTLTTIDVRIVAATNKDLERGVVEGWFREDLYFRLKGLVLRLPPLRERRHDIPAVAERCLQNAAAQAGRKKIGLSQDAVAALQTHAWMGNVRELQHCLEQAVALAEGPLITKADLRLTPPGRSDIASLREPSDPAGTHDASGDAAVLACLRQHEFDMQASARALGWDRSTVTQRLKGMSFRALVASGGDQPKAALALAGDPTLVRTVEWKLREYYEHLLKTIQEFKTPEEAIRACKKRFKNLPDRHFHSVEVLINHYFDRKTGPCNGC
ncbi:MAG TPA: sigma 54-interacting transcriptional regulator [Nitrospiraceae bacterium]|nr:sigma 54-interacting transcriptional regulator [Nitrospiraceae bacterium]